jgi:pyrimidine deaminase RibD-like protein
MIQPDTPGPGEHEKWMREAMREGWKALPGCLPNPPVGCVIVLDGQELARGHTNPPGHPHAEAMALNNLKVQSFGASVYVTLEPCSFDGRTPACAKALVRAAVGRVYVGMIDPHPRNRGRGIDLLRAAGIAVEVGILAHEIAGTLSPYLIRDVTENA